MNKDTVRDNIKILISKGLISYKSLEQVSGLTAGTLYYQINTAKKLDADLFSQLESFLNKQGLSSTSEGKLMQLSKLTLEFNSLVAKTIHILSIQIKDSIDKKEFSEEDKIKVRDTITDFEENVKQEIENLKKVLL